MTVLQALSVLVVVFSLVRLARIGRRQSSLPPGPSTVPLLGNLGIFPTEFAHFRFTEWAREYGDIYSLKLGPGTAIVLTSMKAVEELMERHSATTSDRPQNYLANLVTGGFNMIVDPSSHTKNWRLFRRAAHMVLAPNTVMRHLPIQAAEATQLMYDIQKNGEEFFTHIRRYSNSVIMSVVFGVRSPRYESQWTTLFFKAQHLWELVLEFGAHPPVDIIPLLRYIPERWAPWKALCRETRKLQRHVYFGLLEECRQRMRNGEENGCYMEEILRQQEELGMSNELVGYLGGALIEGGSDTTSLFLQSLVLSLVSFPEVQREAQEEMDRVVGEKRSPRLQDFESLPYIQALVKETHRFRPVAPLAVPHATTADEQYRGYLIPAGSTIFVNTWGIFHDPDFYDEPELFNPGRYIGNEHGLKSGVDDHYFRDNLVFGSGRRVCPGIYLATNSIALNVMNFIWAFDFAHARDPTTGSNIPVDINNYEKVHCAYFQGGILTGPVPFKCALTCRSSKKAEIIKEEFFEAIDTFKQFEVGLSAEDEDWVRKHRG